jgi:2-amino-4-hydroxy-6-hydroxymethyldihydropteridine diphosphokinase
MTNVLVIALGSNLGDKKNNLENAIELIGRHFIINAKSRIYHSPAIEYTDQPDFYNQVIECELPQTSAESVLNKLLSIEQTMGRVRNISKGPRIIDIDIIFFGKEVHNRPELIVPHPAWKERSFVVYPLQELPCFQSIKKCFIIPMTFNNTATVLVD